MKVIYDEFFLKHRPPPGHPHPECPARVSTARTELDGLEVQQAREERRAGSTFHVSAST